MNNTSGSMDGQMAHAGGHMALENLISSATPTHTAVRSGAWSDPNTWRNGKVPGRGATVMIAEGTNVTYDVESDARLENLLIEGTLNFATNKDTKLVVETILNGESGTFNIGSADQSVAADKQTRIVFTSDRTTNAQWDTTQLTKGFVSHGEVNIFGADKLDRVELAGDAVAGNNVLTFKEVPSGWRVGDKIVVGGTEYGWNGSDADNSRFQDEVLTITSISGREVRFTNDDITSGSRNVLRFDHTGSRFADAGETSLYVANISRNVSFETENGKNVPIDRRAHVMLMHNPNVNVFNAGFYDLGRSDKTKLVDDIGEMMDGSQGRGTNVRGRYALHLHQMGVEDPNGTAALLKGNAVVGSPGWGIVQHQSRAGLESNVVFDVVGAGIVAESGDETGWWTGNTVIKATGVDYQTAAAQEDARERKFDFGFAGDGYWVQGAGMIANKDNVAISSNSSGMKLFGSTLKPENNNRPVTTVPISQLPEELRSIFPPNQTEVDIRDIPMATIEGFEAYNGTTGLEIWGHKTNFDGEGAFSENISDRNSQDLPKTAHTVRSKVTDFTLWGNRYAGAKVQYSSNIDLENGQIFGVNSDRIAGGQGLFSNHGSFNSVYDNLEIAGFREGVQIEYPNSDKDFITTTLKNSTLRDNTYNLGAVGDEAPREGRPDDFGAFVRLENNRFETAENNRAPVARFSTQAAGGLAVTLDASASSDIDPLLPADGTPRQLASKGIASYGWDLDNNGTIDRFGRELKHVFDRAGSREISLTVVDAQGEASTVQKTIDVQPSAYGNAFADGDFGANTKTQLPWKSDSRYSDQGWYVKEGSRIAGGVAQISSPGEWNGFVGQVTRNEKIHRGTQTLSFRMKNIEGTSNEWEKNEVTVTLWGVNGQFENNAWEQTGPTKIGSLPMQRTALVRKVYGGQDGPASDFFDWKTIKMDVDLGSGYDYLMFQVNSSASRDANDVVAIDNVSLKGAANAMPGELVPENTLNPTMFVGRAALTNMPDPLVQLSFEEALGRIARDTTADEVASNARLPGAERIEDGRVGRAIALDGADDILRLRNSAELNLGTTIEQRTVSMWFKADDITGDKAQVLYEEGSRAHGINMYIDDGLLRFGGWNRNVQRGWVSTNSIEAGKWHHATLVLDASTANGTLTAYLDGEEVGEMASTALTARPESIGFGNVNRTTRFRGGFGLRGDSGFAGAIDEVQLFDDALSAQQVQQLAIV